MKRFSEKSLLRGVRRLAAIDPEFGDLVTRLGPPPLWDRDEGFPTLIRIILEQQVSLASARAAYDRLIEYTGELTPEALLGIDDQNLKRIGFSRQKTKYARHLAEVVVSGELDIQSLSVRHDGDVRSELMKVKGIGRWTADIYLLMALGRPDVWPDGDLALAIATHRLKRLPERPSYEQLREMSESWRPWRAVAARLLWHYYLSERNAK